MEKVIENKKERKLETIILGGGCFWCLEAVFSGLRGVETAVSGYAGGAAPQPSYEEVCSGTTGHAEVVRIRFDPAMISFRDLLDVFFTIHDPTTLNRQGADVGTQYRSVIFYHSEKQRATAEALMAELEAARRWDRPLVTELLPAPVFYPAEDYHQRYFDMHPEQAYCRAVVAPKVAKARQHFLDKFKK